MAAPQTADNGVGISFDETSETLMAVYFGAIASFVVLFVAIMWRMTNEVLIARRYVRDVTVAFRSCHCESFAEPSGGFEGPLRY